MTYQPGEPPYTQPQDPWSGTHGTASAPTEPLPTPARGPDQFTPGVASPTAWSREGIAYDDSLTSTRTGGGRAGLYVFVGLLVVVLGGAGGYASWWLTSRYAGQLAGSPTTTTTTEPSRSPTVRPTEFRYSPEFVKVETCLINRAPEGKEPEMWVVPCDRPGSYKVLKVLTGADIPEDKRDDFHQPDTARALHADLCADVPSDAWFGLNSPNDALDRFYCLQTNPAV